MIGAAPPMTSAWTDMVLSRRGPKSPRTRAVLYAVHMHTDGDSTRPFPSLTELARMTALSESAAGRYLALAEREGWLVKQGNGWRFCVPPGTET